MTALILVDLQNDFFPGGALGVKEGDTILPFINQLLSFSFDTYVATQDWHPKGHMSFASRLHKQPGEKQGSQTLWPDHCVQNSKGAEFASGWSQEKIEKIIHKGTDPEVDSYSTFFDNGHEKTTGLHEWLQKKGIHTLFIGGLTTEYCVKYSALDAVELGYKVFVIEEACKGVNLNSNDSNDAFEAMKSNGVQVISIRLLEL